MGFFTSRSRTAPPAHPGARAEPSADLRAALPPGFAAVGEALASGMGSVDACAALGRHLGFDGIPLDEALDGLETTCHQVLSGSPGYAETRALAGAWAEATLGYLNRLGCEDPVTGLASLAHLQSRVAELYRGELLDRLPQEARVLVVIEAAGREPRPVGTDVLVADLRVLRLAEAARTVLGPGWPVARVGPGRIVVVSGSDADLHDRVALLRRTLALVQPGEPSVRVEVHPLPATSAAAATVLDRLARP